MAALTGATMVASLLAVGGTPSATADTKPAAASAQPKPTSTAFPRPADPDAKLRAGIAEAKKQNRPVEVTEVAAETSRTWAYPDGHLVTESYSAPARLKQPDGTWAWMDTSLVEQDGVLKPRVAKADVQFSMGGSGPFATMERAKGQEFSLSWGKALPRPVVKGNVATYVGAAGPSADLVVTALTTGFSHDVVLRERPTGPVEFRIPVESSGLTFGKSEQGGLQLTDTKNKVVAEAPEPVMWDAGADGQQGGEARKSRAGSIATSVVREHGQQVLVLKPDAAWLAAPTTRYPVTVDPTTTLNVVTDTTLGSRSECGNFDSPQETLLTVGGTLYTCAGTSKFQYFRSYLKFDTSALAGKAIYTAALQLWRTQAAGCASRGDGRIRAGRLTGSWTAGWMTWANKPATAEDSVYTPCPTTGVTTPGAMSWPITDWVKKWVSGTPNFGVELQGPSESLVNNWDGYSVTFHSAEMTGTGATPPKLIVQYFLPPEIPTVTAESVDSMDGDHAIVRTSSVKVGYRSSSVDGRNLDYYLSVLDSTAPLPAWTTGGGAAAQWSFSEGADSADSSGNGHHLSYVSGRYTSITGKDGKGMQFNGAPTIPSDGSTGAFLHTDKSFSVSGWVRGDTTAGGALFSQRTAAGEGFLVWYSGSTRNFSMTMYNTATSTSGTTITSSATVPIGTWAHVAAVYDAAAHKMRLYVNGVQSAEGNLTSGWDSYTNGTFFINPSGGIVTPAKVSYDEVRAYQRALSETEIKWMLNLTPPTSGNLPSGQAATKTYDVSNVDTFKISVRACLNGITPTTCSESPYYRITTDAPTLPSDTQTGMEDPTQPILSGMVSRPSGGPVTAKYYLYDNSGSPVGAAPLGSRSLHGGERASFQIPANTVQPGTTYKWQMVACAIDPNGVSEVCTSKTPQVSFTTPGAPPPPPVEDVRHLTLGKDSFVIKTVKTDPTACDGGPCTVTDSAVLRIGGVGADRTAAVVKVKLDELPDGAGVSEGILKLGTPICDGGACLSDAVITAAPLKSPVTSETKASDLVGDVDTDAEPYRLPVSAPQADIAGSEYEWLLLNSNKDEVTTFADAAAVEQPSLALTYLPAGPPSAVLNLVAQAGDASAIASWGMPASNGSVALLSGYDVEVVDGDGIAVKALEVKDPYVAITGLTNGQSYAVRVRSKTPFGTSEWESTSVTPKAVPPPPRNDEICTPFLDTPPVNTVTSATTETGAQEYVNRVRHYYEAQDAVLEGRASTVWEAPGVTPSAPNTAKLSLLNAALVEQRSALESLGQSRTDSSVTLDNSVVQGMSDGTVRVMTNVTRTWTEPDQPAEGAKVRATSGQIEPSAPTINVHVFDRCGNMTVIQVPLDVEQDSSDFDAFDVAYLWDSSGPPSTASATAGYSRQSFAGVADVPPPPANEKYWQYGWNMVALQKNWILGIAMSSHWKPFPNCSKSSCSMPLQWGLDPVRNAMKFYPRGRSWGTGPNAPKASWTSDLAKYILKHSTASITTESCFKVRKKNTVNTISFKVGFEGDQAVGDVNGSFQISTEMKDACERVTSKWIRGYPNKPVTFDPDLGLGECEDVVGNCGIASYRSRIDGYLMFKFYNKGEKKDYQEVRTTVLCDAALPNGTQGGMSVTKNCIRSL
ncbi:hypothetical protein Sme01_72570 [Sphaerisporangium melleum]|uniref:Fibronectin type-III domain-containing protein n=1 Tax=Sphaerisporangium melleum TaxID=321316 RepID=A0A917RPU6_9ACTN|nr:LamG-like jellyroll fold domain-containing protein [Sphaerisporangium melleum]GGL18400.1 hypothetical protein GCM10007964_70540 [Sphaerisporangium melleum]GII74781.1 hypothetical protein Sme01_72570 [Sphaerisporangium melleum]